MAEEKQQPKKEEKPTPAPKPEKKPEPTGKYKDLIKQIESLSLAELSELVKELEERFGVSAAPSTIAPALPAEAQAKAEHHPCANDGSAGLTTSKFPMTKIK